MVNSVWWGVVPVAAVCVLGGLSVGVQGVAVADANDGTGAVLRFARQYGNDMVLQAGGKGATVWGYAPPGDTVSVTVTKDRHPVINSAVQALVRRAFSTRLTPVPPHLPYSPSVYSLTQATVCRPSSVCPCVRARGSIIDRSVQLAHGMQSSRRSHQRKMQPPTQSLRRARRVATQQH